MNYRPYNRTPYETLLRQIGLFVPSHDRSEPTDDNPEARAFHAMSELWQRLVVERKTLHKLKPRKRAEKPIGDTAGAISDARKYPHISGDPEMLQDQANAMARIMLDRPDITRSQMQQRVWNLAPFKHDRNRLLSFNKLWGLLQNEIAEGSNPE